MKINNLIKLLIVGLILIIGLNGCYNDNQKRGLEKNETIDPYFVNEPVEEKETLDPILEEISKMTLEEKIGQVIIGGFDGWKYEGDLRLLNEDYKLGGFIFFKPNMSLPEETQALVEEIKNKASLIPFIAIDEEDKTVTRLGPEFESLPLTREVGQMESVEIAREYGSILAKRLSYLGFNVNFGPVLDIDSNPANPVIATRSLSRDKDLVARLGSSMERAMDSQGILGFAKHFPGHGDTDQDSHISLPILKKSLKDLKEEELYPFKYGIEQGLRGVMVGHILFPEIDDYPASMSNIFISDILRSDLGFEGLVVSDDMTMAGITENYKIEDAAIRFIDGGGDLVLVCHGIENIKKVRESLIDAYLHKPGFNDKIDQSLYRILREKKNLSGQNTMDLKEINKATRELKYKLK